MTWDLACIDYGCPERMHVAPRIWLEMCVHEESTVCGTISIWRLKRRTQLLTHDYSAQWVYGLSNALGYRV